MSASFATAAQSAQVWGAAMARGDNQTAGAASRILGQTVTLCRDRGVSMRIRDTAAEWVE